MTCRVKIEEFKGFMLGVSITGTVQPAKEDGVFTVVKPKIGAEIAKNYRGVTYKLMGEYGTDKKDTKIGFGVST